jgi:uncharacterized protein (TIGR00251 family)
MVDITSRQDGITFAVKVLPRASRNEIVGVQDGVLRIRLTAPPLEGAANKALVKFLAGALDVPKQDITILAGHTSRQKVIAVASLSPQELSIRLQDHLPST